MSILRVPVTATLMPEWVRRCADAVNAVLGRVDSFDGFIAAPGGTSFSFQPDALPTSPIEGMTVYDSADKKVKTWDGTAWQPHY